MILTPSLDVLLVTAIILPFFSLMKDKKFLWLRNSTVVTGILFSLYFLFFSNSTTGLLLIDNLSIYFSSIFLIFGLLIAIYSFKENKGSKFYSLLLFTLTGLIGVTFASDFFTLFVFWELMTISSYPLVWFGNDKKILVGAALKYIFMSVAGGASLLFALSLLYGQTGTLDFMELSNLLPSIPFIKAIIALIVAGFGVEAIIFPFHFWAPDVYQVSNPTVSSFFASLLSKSGIFGLMRVLYLVFPFTLWTRPLAILALVSMTFGNLMALTEDNLKRLLAFSSTAHLSFILFAISLGTIQGKVAGLFHVLNHTILMSSLFFCSGVFSQSIGPVSLKKLEGVCKKLSVPTITFLVSCLAAGGMPPFNGFIGELLILLAGISKRWFLFSGVLLFNLFLALVVFLRIVKNSLEGKKEFKIKENVWIAVPMILLLILIVLIGIYPSPILSILERVV